MSLDIQGAVVRGALAHLVTSTPAKLLGFVLTVLAAHVLSPGDYGEFNLAVTIYGVSDLLTNPSMFTFFVRTPNANAESLDSGWSFSVLRGIVLTIVFWLLAGPLAELFDGGEGVKLLLQLLSTTFFFAALRNPWVVSIYHQLEYRRMAIVESFGGLIGNVAGIGLLWWSHNPAALATGVITAQAVGCVMTWIYAERRPRFMIDWTELSHIWRFTRFLLINNMVIFLLLQLDDVFVVKVTNLELLGLYALAYKVANDSVLFLINTLRQVLLPAFVKLVDDAKAFAKAGMRAVGTLSAVSWVLATMVFVGANELMILISPDPQWRGSELLLQALMPFVLIRAVNGVFGSLLLAVGKPQVLSVVAGAQLAGLFPLMWAGYEAGLWWGGTQLDGVLGVTVAIAFLNYAANFSLMLYSDRQLNISIWRSMGLMWLLAPVAAGTAYLGFMVKSPDWPAWLSGLISMSLVGIIMVGFWELLVRAGNLHQWVDSPVSLIVRARRRKPSA